MSPPVGWQRGSFRGVPFVTREHEVTGGRRLVPHEFPQGEKPVLEDLGKRAAFFTLELHVIGSDHIAQANRLADALDAPGAGTLIHPWLGSMQVGVDRYGRRDSVSEGRVTAFSIDFIESGLPSVPAPAQDTSAQAKAVGSAERVAGKDRFADRFGVVGVTAFVEQASEELVRGMALAAQVRAGLSGGVGPSLRAFSNIFDRLGVAGIARDALALGSAIVDMIQIVGSLGTTADGLASLFDWSGTVGPVIGSTPARALERANQAELIQIFDLAVACELVDVIAGSAFVSYEDAVGVRDRVADRLDRLALRQADLGDDDGAAAYDALRRALVRDVTARGGSLARLQRFTPAVTEPALVIANRLYGRSEIEARAAEIVARNGIRHPGFVPGGRTIEVLTPSGLADG